MASVRSQLLRQYPLQACTEEHDGAVAAALYAMLRSTDKVDLIVDGWILFQVVRESKDSLDALGLMTLLPSGSIPMSISVRADEHGLAWSAQVARQDRDWLALSDSKRWNSVYLYAIGGREEPPWTWDRRYQGLACRADD